VYSSATGCLETRPRCEAGAPQLRQPQAGGRTWPAAKIRPRLEAGAPQLRQPQAGGRTNGRRLKLGRASKRARGPHDKRRGCCTTKGAGAADGESAMRFRRLPVTNACFPCPPTAAVLLRVGTATGCPHWTRRTVGGCLNHHRAK
jgi:hypothetical protein